MSCCHPNLSLNPKPGGLEFGDKNKLNFLATVDRLEYSLPVTYRRGNSTNQMSSASITASLDPALGVSPGGRRKREDSIWKGSRGGRLLGKGSGSIP